MLERVEILHNFEGGREDELVLVKGDVVHVTGKGADGWCLGACELYASFYPHALGDTGGPFVFSSSSGVRGDLLHTAVFSRDGGGLAAFT